MAKKYYIQYVQTRGGITPDLQCAKIEYTNEDKETLLEHAHVLSVEEMDKDTPVGEVVLGEIIDAEGEVLDTYPTAKMIKKAKAEKPAKEKAEKKQLAKEKKALEKEESKEEEKEVETEKKDPVEEKK